MGGNSSLSVGCSLGFRSRGYSSVAGGSSGGCFSQQWCLLWLEREGYSCRCCSLHGCGLLMRLLPFGWGQAAVVLLLLVQGQFARGVSVPHTGADCSQGCCLSDWGRLLARLLLLGWMQAARGKLYFLLHARIKKAKQKKR